MTDKKETAEAAPRDGDAPDRESDPADHRNSSQPADDQSDRDSADKSQQEPAAASAETALPRHPGSTALFVAGLLAMAAAVGLLIFAVIQRQSSAPTAAAPAADDNDSTTGASNALTMPDVDRSERIATTDPTADLLAAATQSLQANSPDFNNPAFDRFLQTEAKPETAAALEIPPERRWQFFFADKLTTGGYAEQLDALGIELGVVGGGNQIEYASKLSQAKPERRTGPAADEHRLYLSWTRGDLQEADRELLSNAGIDQAGKIVLHFCDEATIQKLAELELAYQNRQPIEIERTRFGVKPRRGSFEFYVLDQEQRR